MKQIYYACAICDYVHRVSVKDVMRKYKAGLKCPICDRELKTVDGPILPILNTVWEKKYDASYSRDAFIEFENRSTSDHVVPGMISFGYMDPQLFISGTPAISIDPLKYESMTEITSGMESTYPYLASMKSLLEALAIGAEYVIRANDFIKLENEWQISTAYRFYRSFANLSVLAIAPGIAYTMSPQDDANENPYSIQKDLADIHLLISNSLFTILGDCEHDKFVNMDKNYEPYPYEYRTTLEGFGDHCLKGHEYSGLKVKED